MEAGESSFIFSSETPFISGELTEIMPLESRTASDSPFRMLRAKRYGRWVALKALKPEYVENPFYEGILAKEFSIGYGLQHNGIARTLGFVALPDVGNAIESDYVDGVTLREYIAAHKPLAREEVRRIAGELCEAVGYLHSRGVMHRDLKPDNIMIESQTGLVKLIDFGCADTPDFAILKSPAGTLRYAAPEQFDAGKEANPQADIYAIGVVISDLLMAAKHADSRLRRIAKKCQLAENVRYRSIHELQIDFQKKKKSILIVLLFCCGLLIVLLAFRIHMLENTAKGKNGIIYHDSVCIEKSVKIEHNLYDQLIMRARTYSEEYFNKTLIDLQDSIQSRESRKKIYNNMLAEYELPRGLSSIAIETCNGDSTEALRYIPAMVTEFHRIYSFYEKRLGEAYLKLFF